MKEYTIGIKTGDGKFYPVLEESFKGKKRFILTTVNDNQTSVQIDFYRNADQKIDSADYIGSLVIENIEPAAKRVPEIEVIVGIDKDKSLHAVAKNLSSEDDKQSLTVSLESLASGMTYDIPEFELDEKLQPTSLFESDQELDDDNLTGESYPLDAQDSRKKHLQKQKANPLFVFLFILAGILIIAAVTFGVFSFCNKVNQDDKPPLEAENAGGEALAAQTATEPTIIPAATKPAQTDSPVPTKAEITIAGEASGLPPAAAKDEIKKNAATGGGYTYAIKWGDTLWDIAEDVYGNPWLYKDIYNNNKKTIPYPDLIFSGTKIYIPEK